ncbi:unnamed protein product [Nezara viridula]|uniref:THAP-type domain-containing protein n=1 Tax=Nezara viridula TaxID=85310 RepID=A0A9P0H0R3_NEZVI|nr:unnamed protein product [Nezara viridula]
MTVSYEILVILRHYWKKNFTAAEATREIIKYEGEGVLDQRTARRWFEKFTSGDTTLERKKGSGRPLMDIDKALQEAIKSNPSTTTRELARECGVSKDTVNRHLLSMEKVKNISGMVPHELTPQQSTKRMPGTRCAVATCNNNLFDAKRIGKKISFHCFPKDDRRKDWAVQCKRADKYFNPATSCICSEHFSDSDFERDFQAELLGLQRKRKLKKTAIPTLNLDNKKENLFQISKYGRQKKRELKFIVKNVSVQTESNVSNDPDDATYCDEEENYESSLSTGVYIKVEPGLIDDVYQDDVSNYETKDFLAGCIKIKQEADPDSMNEEEHVNSLIDIDNTTFIKKEKDESYLDFPHGGVKIKIEPNLGEDDA